jgi:hypothetical protein
MAQRVKTDSPQRQRKNEKPETETHRTIGNINIWSYNCVFKDLGVLVMLFLCFLARDPDHYN